MNDIRILVVSHRNLDRPIWRCGFTEFEDVVAEIDAVEILAPAARMRGTAPLVTMLRRALHRTAGVRLEFDLRAERTRLRRRYDLVFVVAQKIRDLALLRVIPNWRDQCDKAVCWLDEAWLADLPEERHVAILRQFDHIAVGLINTVPALRQRTGVSCAWLPPAVDTLRFAPGPTPPERTIDFYAMGRKSDVTHRATREFCRKHGWTYLFDTFAGSQVRDLQEHRQQLAETIKRARYFLVNRAKADVPEETAGQSELATRFFEGAAGGAVLVGEAPRSPSFQECFGWEDSLVPLPYGSTGVDEIFDQLERDPERIARMRRRNVVESLRRHDWAYRWQQILRSVNLPVSSRIEKRLAAIEELAQWTEQSAADAGSR